MSGIRRIIAAATYDPAMDHEPQTCSKCGERPAGEGGILCSTCLAVLEEHASDHITDEAPAGPQ